MTSRVPVVRRAQKPRLMLHVLFDFLKMPNVVPTGNHIRAGTKELIGDLGCQTPSIDRIFAVYHDAIQFQLLTKPWKPRNTGIDTALTHNIANK